MTSKRRAILLPVIVALLAMAGCGERDYDREGLDLQSKRADQVRVMLDALRETSSDAIDTHIAAYGASELTADQAEALARWLQQIQTADEVRLLAVDRFGKQVYRATIELQHKEGTGPTYGLLVEVDGKLKWAGPN